MKLAFEHTIENRNYSFISDDTSALDEQTLFLKTAQNSSYYEKLEPKPAFITPEELIAFWGLEKMKVVGVTGTNGKKIGRAHV